MSIHPTTSRFLALSLLLALAACEEQKPEQDTSAKRAPAPTAKASALPVATTIPAKRDEPEEDPTADIQCAEGKTADFHDPHLEKEIRRKLDKAEGDIPVSMLKKVRSVNLAKGDRVDYLDPCIFPHLTGVRDLFLGPGKLRDISVLSHLKKLTALRASMNNIEDISVLSQLKNLDRLDLGRTKVSDVKPLARLTELTELMLDDTLVSDVSPLASLTKLEVLTLSRTQVKDISPLKPLEKLKSLTISGAPVDDPLAVSRPGLKVIDE